MQMMFAVMLLIQAAPAQSEADKLEAALKKFGDRSYLILEKGEKIGAVTLRTRVEKEGGRSVAVFEDRITHTMNGREFTLTMTEEASTDRLRLLSSRKTVKGDDKEEHWSISVAEAKALMKVEGREQTIEITDVTIGEEGVMRLVCAAEQKEGSSFKTDVLSMTAERLETGHDFKCLGKEQVEINGRKFDAFKWEQKGEWKFTRKIGDQEVPGTSRVNHTYWVSPDGYLLRVSYGSRMEVVLDAK